MQLNKEAIMQAKDRSIEQVDVPEWGGFIYLSTMDAKTRESWEEQCLTMRGQDIQMNTKNVRASLLQCTICDEEGNLLFTKTEIDELSKKSGVVLDRLFMVARKVNRIGEQDVDDLVKNSNSDLDDSSPTV